MKRTTRPVARSGAILIYSIYIMLLMTAMISLAVDYGRVQMIKTELQRAADATARGALELYIQNGRSTSGLTASYLTTKLVNNNPIDENSGISPTVSRTWGYWKNNAFHSGTNSSYPTAVQILISRSASNNNAVPLAFPLPSGSTFVTRSCDVWASSIAMLPAAVSINLTVQSTWDPWLAGTATGTTASYDDSSPNQQETSPTAVIPGSTITISSVTGDVMHTPSNPTDGPDGETSNMYWHMKDPPSGAVAEGQGAQNNIGDIETPIDSLIGVFLNGNANGGAPSAANAPTVVRSETTDYNQSTPIDNIQLQQPFYVGDGTNYNHDTQTFVVPADASNLYLGIMDGYEWANNNGSFTVTGTEQPPIEIVQ